MIMKKIAIGYLSVFFCAFFLSFAIVSVWFFAIALLEVSGFYRAYFLIMSLGCIGCLILMLIKGWNEIFTCVYFEEKGIRVKTLFKESYVIEYSKCVEVGIAYSKKHHADDPRIRFFYFSYSKIDDSYKSRINFIHQSKTFVKIVYSKKLYNYLLENLPKRLLAEIKKSYKI